MVVNIGPLLLLRGADKYSGTVRCHLELDGNSLSPAS